MRHRKYIRAQRGFTFIELCLGMIVTAMIASALAAFTLAVANCWRQADETPSSSIMANQLMQRMYGRLNGVKAWLALLQPKAEQRQTLLTMEFKQFLQVWLTLPCQILDRGRQFVFRLVSYNAWVPVLLATVDLLHNCCLT